MEAQEKEEASSARAEALNSDAEKLTEPAAAAAAAESTSGGAADAAAPPKAAEPQGHGSVAGEDSSTVQSKSKERRLPPEVGFALRHLNCLRAIKSRLQTSPLPAPFSLVSTYVCQLCRAGQRPQPVLPL